MLGQGTPLTDFRLRKPVFFPNLLNKIFILVSQSVSHWSMISLPRWSQWERTGRTSVSGMAERSSEWVLEKHFSRFARFLSVSMFSIWFPCWQSSYIWGPCSSTFQLHFKKFSWDTHTTTLSGSLHIPLPPKAKCLSRSGLAAACRCI